MFKNILLATDFSAHAEVAKKAAISMSRESTKKLTVLNVLTHLKDIELQEGVLLPSDRVDDAERKAHLARHKNLLNQYCQEIESEGIAHKKTVTEGDHPDRIIIKTAEKIKADLIIIGSHSKRNILDALLGGTAASVSKDAPCPVMIVSHFNAAEYAESKN